MERSRRQSGLAYGGLAGVVGIAYAVGREREVGLIPIGTLAAVALAVAALFVPRAVERAAGVALLVWVALAAATEQFAWAASDRGVLVAIVWLVPPVIGGAVLPARGYWRSGLGCWAAAFAGIAATTYSLHSVHSGAGLLMRWLS